MRSWISFCNLDHRFTWVGRFTPCTISKTSKVWYMICRVTACLTTKTGKKPATGKTGHSFCNGKKLLLSVYEEAVCNFDHRSIWVGQLAPRTISRNSAIPSIFLPYYSRRECTIKNWEQKNLTKEQQVTRCFLFFFFFYSLYIITCI
jgi:hypothetical protein